MKEWTPNDAASLREYDQATRAALRAQLRRMLPKITGNSIEEVALSSKFRAGAEYLIDSIDNLMETPKPQTDGSAATFVSM
jgi:hypothetical protein